MHCFRHALQTLACALVFGCFAIWSNTTYLKKQEKQATLRQPHSRQETPPSGRQVTDVARQKVVDMPMQKGGQTFVGSTGSTASTASFLGSTGSSKRLFFLFWLVNLSPTPDNLFALDLAAELVALGHLVIVESAAGGELRNAKNANRESGDHHREHPVRVKVNPVLGELLAGEKVSEIWKIVSASFNGNNPNIIICFSALWKKVGLYLPQDGLRPSRCRLVWYFYSLDCKDADREKGDIQEVRQITAAMSNFDMVLYTTDATRLEWAKNNDGKYFTFRPFLRTDVPRFSVQVAKDRDEIRSTQRISLDGFLVTIVDCPWCKREVDLSSTKLVEIMRERFGRDWLIVVHQNQTVPTTQQGPLSKNIIWISDWEELLQYVQAADLHVSLSPANFAFDMIHARSFAVPVLTLPSELCLQHSLDCFILRTVKQATLEGKISSIISKPSRVLYEVGEAGRQAVLPGFLGSAVTTRVSHFVDRLNHLLLSSSTFSKKHIGIFIQLLNPSTEFQFIWPCIQNILDSQSRSSVDVTISTPLPIISSLEEAVAKIRSRREVSYIIASQAEDRGADVGIFLQQLLLMRELSVSPVIIFKLHWKFEQNWEALNLQPLCGSVSTVRRAIGAFTSDATSGIIGPPKLTWNLKDQEAHEVLNHFGGSKHVQHEMMSSWSLISNSDLPEEKHLWIVTGGCYWVRMDIDWWEDFIFPVATKLLVSMGPHDAVCLSGCQVVPAMQWLIPSIISRNGNKVVARKFK